MARKRCQLIASQTLERTATVLRVLGHPDRLRMIELLSQKELTVGELAEAVGIAPAACSQHLNLMKAHGILRAVRTGRTINYEVAEPSALSVIECIRRHGR